MQKKATKKSVKKSTKIKRKAQVVILAPTATSEKVLLLRTNKKRGQIWQNVTGTVEKKESMMTGALREAQEETGLDFDDIHFFIALPCAFRFQDKWGKDVYEACYVIVLKNTFTPKLSSEHDKFMWKDCSKVKEKSYHFGTNYEAFKEAMQAC